MMQHNKQGKQVDRVPKKVRWEACEALHLDKKACDGMGVFCLSLPSGADISNANACELLYSISCLY